MPEWITIGAVILVGLYLREYVRKKAQNLASKEDVAELTEEVERVKSSYRVQEELLRADLQRKARIHQAQMDLELSIYKEIWEGMTALDAALVQVQSYGLVGHPKAQAARASFDAERTKVEEVQERAAPFIDRGVLAALMKLQVNMRLIALKSLDGTRTTEAERTDAIKEWVKTLGDCKKELREAIRDRLFADEARPETVAESGTGQAGVSVRPPRTGVEGSREVDGTRNSDEPNVR